MRLLTTLIGLRLLSLTGPKEYSVRTKTLTSVEVAHLEKIKLWLDSLQDWLAFVATKEEFPLEYSSDAPPWVRICMDRVDKTLFAPVNAALGEHALTPYSVGYALGLMKWGDNRLTAKPPPEVKQAVKGIRLSKIARRKLVRMCEDFYINVQIAVRKNGGLRLSFQRELSVAERVSRKYVGRDASDFHRGLSDGLRGVGRDVPGDRSTDATDVYLVLVLWWRFVARLSSVSELHVFIGRCLGPKLVGEKKRTEKICQRLGLSFRAPGRPKLIPTLAPPG